MWQALLPILASVAGTLMTKNKKNTSPGTTVTQEPLTTPEQQKALDMLLNYSKTGQWGGSTYTPGETYGGATGNYDMTGMEQAGQDKLMSMLSGGTGINYDSLGLAQDELKKLLGGNTYDPYSETGLFKGFKRNAQKEAADATDMLKRNAAFSGNLYSRDTVKQMGKVQENTGNALQDKLAELYDTYTGRRLTGVNQALNAQEVANQTATANQNIGLNQISATQEYGKLSRVLADQEAKDKYSAWLQQRKEMGDSQLNQISAARDVAGGTQWGAKSVTLPSTYSNEPSPWADVLNQMMKFGTEGLGKYGESAGWYKA
jgi:hypothetical protein